MTELSQIAGKSQVQHQVQIQTLLQTQSIIMMNTQDLEARIDLELMQNPALEIEEELADEDLLVPLEDEDIMDEDYYKPPDEYETGYQDVEGGYDIDDVSLSLERKAVDRWRDNPERLRKAIKAIDDHRHSGTMSDDTLLDDLTDLETATRNRGSLSNRSDIEVIAEGGHVEICLVSNKGDYLKYKKGMGRDTNKAQKFIDDIQHRKRFLMQLCALLLGELQRDFFLEKNTRIALLNLIPVQIPVLCDSITDELFPTKQSLEKLIYRSEHLIVSCFQGRFPLNFFLPSQSSLLILWIKDAQRNGKIKQREQRLWINEQIEKRVSTWTLADRRRQFIQSTIDISINDIKYANKKSKHGKA